MTTQTTPSSLEGLRPVYWAMGLLGLAFAAGGLAWFGWVAGLSVAIGVLLGMGNLWLLAKVVSAFLGMQNPELKDVLPGSTSSAAKAAGAPETLSAPQPGAPRMSRGGLVFLAVFKFAALFGGVFLLMRLGLVDILALGVGYGVLPMGILFGQFKTAPNSASSGRPGSSSLISAQPKRVRASVVQSTPQSVGERS